MGSSAWQFPAFLVKRKLTKNRHGAANTSQGLFHDLREPVSTYFWLPDWKEVFLPL